MFLCFPRERTNREERKKNLVSLSSRFLISKNKWNVSIRFLIWRKKRMKSERKVTHCRPLLSLYAAIAVFNLKLANILIEACWRQHLSFLNLSVRLFNTVQRPNEKWQRFEEAKTCGILINESLIACFLYPCQEVSHGWISARRGKNKKEKIQNTGERTHRVNMTQVYRWRQCHSGQKIKSGSILIFAAWD